MWRKKLPASIKSNEVKAERLKAKIIKGPHKVEKEAQRLNELLLADGITLKVFYATGGDKRHG